MVVRFAVLPVIAMAGGVLAQMASPSTSSVASSGSASAPGITSAGAIASNIQRAYAGVTTYAANFHQQYVQKAFGRTTVSDGHMVFVRPNKMRWDYTNGNVTVSDGTTLKSYDASSKQMKVMAAPNTQVVAAIAFLTGSGSLATSFNLTLLNLGKTNFAGGHVLEARPKVPTSAYEFVLFYVDDATSHIRRVLLVDSVDSRNRIDFDNPIVNGSLANTIFVYLPPPGTSVINLASSGGNTSSPSPSASSAPSGNGGKKTP